MCTHQFDVVLWPEENEHGLQMLLDVSWSNDKKHKSDQREFIFFFYLFSMIFPLPACLLRSCEKREAVEVEEPFPRGKKRAAPLTVRKLSLMLDTERFTRNIKVSHKHKQE